MDDTQNALVFSKMYAYFSFKYNFALVVTYRPIKLNGLGFQIVYTEQGITKVDLIMRHICYKSELGKAIFIVLKVIHLEVLGISWSILQHPTIKLVHMALPWTIVLQEFI